MEKQKAKHKTRKILLFSLAALLLLMALGFILYTANYYHADTEALALLQNNEALTVQGDLTILHPSTPSDTALIFYPGAKVEHTAYLPILEKLRQNGITCVLVQKPFNMAIFKPNAANQAFTALPNIQNWYIGGHSMGGAMASSYAAKNPEKLKGLILLGAYIYGDYPPENTLTIYGSLNESVGKKINYTQNVLVIEGGNHAQFGNYGPQKGDAPATINAEEQQNKAVEAILAFTALENA